MKFFSANVSFVGYVRGMIFHDAFDECVSAVFYFETHSHFGGGRTIAIAFSS